MPKGQKECKCGATMGPRTKICPNCKAVLIQDVETVDENGNTIVAKNTRNVYSYPEGYVIPEGVNMLRISVPFGIPPIKLKPGIDETIPGSDTIVEWAINVREKMIHDGVFLTNCGLLYWARQEFNRYPTDRDTIMMIKQAISTIPDVTYKVVEVAGAV